MKGTSRRGFLKTVGAAAAAPAVVPQAPSARTRRSSFAPASELRRLSDNLHLLEDTCNVYLVRDGSRAIVIDFGSGKILDHLDGLGITQVDWVLHAQYCCRLH